MPKPATGELCRIASGWEARITIEGKQRKAFTLDAIGPTDEESARVRCTAMAQIAARLRRAGHQGKVETLLRLAAKARGAKAWDAIGVAVDALCTPGGTTALATGKVVPTFGELAREWCNGKLHERYPDDISKKRTSDDDLQRLGKWVFPVLEHIPLDHVTLAHAREVLGRIPPTKSRSTRKHVALLMNRVLKFAVYPCEHIGSHPLPPGFGGRKGSAKAMTYLYPSEDRKLLSCEDVLIVHRLFYGFLSREGLRSNEAQLLTWADLDLERGSLRLDRNKTDDPRAWALDAGVLRALKWWRERHADDEPSARVFRALEKPYWMAIMFRRHLEAARIDRAELTEKSDIRQPIRVHDLRATFVTVALANGKTEAWIADRTGHKSSAMINRYRRTARTHAELGQGALAPLDVALGLPDRTLGEERSEASLPDDCPIPVSSRDVSCDLGPENAEPSESLENHAASARCSNPLGDAVISERSSNRRAIIGESAPDPVEVALAFALTEAAKAGRFDVVGQVARELEARRLARTPNVVTLETKRRRS
jgi:integrase